MILTPVMFIPALWRCCVHFVLALSCTFRFLDRMFLIIVLPCESARESFCILALISTAGIFTSSEKLNVDCKHFCRILCLEHALGVIIFLIKIGA